MNTVLPDEGLQIGQALADDDVVARLFGGVAIALTCESARSAPLQRAYGDLDLVSTRKSAKKVGGVLAEFGYRPAERFNSLHGRARMLFEGDRSHVDVFVSRFEMCHELELEPRLELVPLTLSLADLLLTKLQVAKVNHKDVTDMVAILIDHDFTGDNTGIELERLTGLLSADWGWWRTATENLRKIEELGPTLGLGANAEERLGQQLSALTLAIEQQPKTFKWRSRARVGDRVAWRNDPEEIDH